MPVDLPDIVAAQESNRRRRRRKPRTLRPTFSLKRDAIRTEREIRLALLAPLNLALRTQLWPVLRRTEDEYLVDSARVRDDYADEITGVLERIRSEHMELTRRRASVISLDMTQRANLHHRARFYAGVEQMIGVDLSGVVDESGLKPVLQAKTRENVSLITTIPNDYFDDIETMVWENVVQGRTSAKSMIQELQEMEQITVRRARFIARDQTAKLNAAINRERNQALGIEEYFWRIVRDASVRPNHRSKADKVFRWDNPPADTGHPGEDYQCRCRAEPIIRF